VDLSTRAQLRSRRAVRLARHRSNPTTAGKTFLLGSFVHGVGVCQQAAGVIASSLRISRLRPVNHADTPAPTHSTERAPPAAPSGSPIMLGAHDRPGPDFHHSCGATTRRLATTHPAARAPRLSSVFSFSLERGKRLRAHRATRPARAPDARVGGSLPRGTIALTLDDGPTASPRRDRAAAGTHATLILRRRGYEGTLGENLGAMNRARAAGGCRLFGALDPLVPPLRAIDTAGLECR